MKELEVFKKIFDICKNHEKENDSIEEIKRKCELEIFRNEIINKYKIDIPINKINNTRYIRISDLHGEICLGIFNEDNVCNMDEKPNNEMLLAIQFPTGAYIFGESYDRELFNDFYKELKQYKPKFCDDLNHYLYFDLKNASKIYNEYGNIYKKYRDIYNSKIYKRKIDELKNEIEYWEKRDKELKK